MTVPVIDYAYAATVERIIDGDTWVLDIDLGFDTHTIQHVRLRGADCPELNTDAGQAARKFVTDLLAQYADGLVVQTQKIPERSFARFVADVWLPDGRSLADVLVAAGQAVKETP